MPQTKRNIYRLDFFGPADRLEEIVETINSGHFPLFDSTDREEQACIYRWREDDHTALFVTLPTTCTPEHARGILTEAYPPEVECCSWIALENVTVMPGGEA